MKRGRPVTISSDKLMSVLLKYKAQIFDEETGTVLTKQDPLWAEISDEVLAVTEVKKSASALYTHVTCRNPFSKKKNDKSPHANNNLDDTAESVLNSSAASDTGEILKIHFSKSEFEELISEKNYRQNDSKKKAKTRLYKIFVPGKWQLTITKKLWDEHRIRCGFLYEHGRMYKDGASMKGNCKCGSSFDGVVTDLNREVIVVTCTLSKSSGFLQCNKRPCRQPEREEIGKRLVENGKSASVAEKEAANDLMCFGDLPPPHLYDQRTLRDAKSEYAIGLHVHKDVITALLILQSEKLKNSIHAIGLRPFYVCYWSAQQLQVYLEYCRARGIDQKISFDASGRLVQKVTRSDGSVTGHVFLYTCVIDWFEQYAVCQMLSEKHDALHIAHWLRLWKNHGATPPKEVVSDDGKALLIAAISAFTIYRTISEYVNACWEKKNISCYIRIDVAHYMKKYAILLKNTQPLVKKFFMASIGQLIVCQSHDEAGKILRHILVVCQAAYSGCMDNGELTACSKSVDGLKKILIQRRHEELQDEIEKLCEETVEEADVERAGDDGNEDDNEITGPNKYRSWAMDINMDVTDIVKTQKGHEPNPYLFLPLVKKLLADSKEFPMWSCVARDLFGYGSVPASSANVESDFNNLKTRLMEKRVGVRADEFIQRHLEYTSGAANIIIGKQKLSEGTNNGDLPFHKDTAKDNSIENALRDITNLEDSSNAKIIDDFLSDDVECNFIDPIINLEDSSNVSIIDDFLLNDVEYNIIDSMEAKEFENSTVQLPNDCEACANGHFPTGLHKCVVCGIVVHLFDACSEVCPGSEEGCGQRRICKRCCSKEKIDVESILSSRETEQWRGLKNPDIASKKEKKTKKSIYIWSNYLKNDFKAKSKIPEKKILKNANCIGSKAYEINGIKYSVTNTCGFDALTQLILKAARDAENKKALLAWGTDYSDFVIKLCDFGVTSNTYAKRTAILLKITPENKERKIPGITLLNCETAIGELSGKLFHDHPFAIETIKCNECTKRLSIPLTTISVEITSVKSNLNKMIGESLRVKETSCNECAGKNISDIAITGPFLLIDVYTMGIETKRMKVTDIPKEVTFPGVERTMKLEGFVSFKPPMTKTRRSAGKTIVSPEDKQKENLLKERAQIGHYTAVIMHENGQCTEIDDISFSEKPLVEKSVIPNLLVYTYIRKVL